MNSTRSFGMLALDLVLDSRPIRVKNSDVDQATFVEASGCGGEEEWKETYMSVHFKFAT